MIAGILQYNPSYLDVDANLDRVESFLEGVDADLLVLPELFATGYFFRSAGDLAKVAEEAQGGRTTSRMLQWSRDSGATIVGGFAERQGDKIFNSAVVTTPDGRLHVYRKVHLFYKEKEIFEPGDLGFPVFDVTDRSGVPYKLGVMICFDWYFPEAARTLALSGADVIVHPSNLVRKDCPRSMPIRALENHVFTITANRVGSEMAGAEELTFIGQSVACDPSGNPIVNFDREEEGLRLFEIDPVLARNRDITLRNNLFGDRRPATYRLG